MATEIFFSPKYVPIRITHHNHQKNHQPMNNNNKKGGEKNIKTHKHKAWQTLILSWNQS